MKRLCLFLLVALVLYVVYFDLSVGTLPNVSVLTESTETINEIEEEEKIASFSVKVKKGETVLSIVEMHMDAPIPVPIEQVVKDFSVLNNGKKPEEIQYGKTYLFPDYRNTETSTQ